MFGISFGELLLIGIVGLVVLGPERLPVVARTLGRIIRQVQGYTNAFKEELNRELHNAEILELEKELSAEGRKLKAEIDQSTTLEENVSKAAEEAGKEDWHAGTSLPPAETVTEQEPLADTISTPEKNPQNTPTA